jgi:hypothetical protein
MDGLFSMGNMLTLQFGIAERGNPWSGMGSPLAHETGGIAIARASSSKYRQLELVPGPYSIMANAAPISD